MIEQFPKGVCIAVMTAVLALHVSCGEKAEEGERTDLGTESNTELELSADHLAWRQVLMADAASVSQHFGRDKSATFEFESPFRQLGAMMAGDAVDELEYRIRARGEDWREWSPLRPYWSDSQLHNAHATFDTPVIAIQLRGGEGLDFIQLEFYETVTARNTPLSADTPTVESVPLERFDDGSMTHRQQAIAPDELVVSRHDWGAIDPDKICNSVVPPDRMTLHHTAGPTSEGGDSQARMRQIQDFHINTRGWCDIGYHFVVDHYGEIFQGRSRSNRPGAHVANHNLGNVGVSMIGTFTDITPPQSQIEGVIDIMNWIHETHDIALDRESVRGHREWPGAATACPGDRGLAQLDSIVEALGGDAEPEADYDVQVEIAVDELDDFYVQGSSDGIPDALVGDRFRAHLQVTNLSTEPLRDVELGYDFESAGVHPVNYQIESDHPAYDQSSWEINDANEAPENPESDQLGLQGGLTLHAFSPQETKRVRIDFEASQYNLANGDDRGLRTWIKQIDGLYETQQNFGESPSIDAFGELLQAQSRIDVLTATHWRFESGESQEMEGWSGNGAFDELRINPDYDSLSQRRSGESAAIVSPAWTDVNADAFDEMVIRVRDAQGEYRRSVTWSGAQNPTVEFDVVADGEFQTLVIPVGEHPDWNGRIQSIQFGMVAPDELAASSAWSDVDYVFFQNRQTGETSAPSMDIVDIAPVTIDEAEQQSEDPPRPGYIQPFPGVDHGTGTIEAKSGCTSVHGGSSFAAMLWFLGFLLVFWFKTPVRALATRLRRHKEPTNAGLSSR